MVTIIDDQIVEQLESFEVIISFPSNQPALQSSDIVPPGMQINGMINIIDDDGEFIGNKLSVVEIIIFAHAHTCIIPFILSENSTLHYIII